ncbi:glycosyltransferase family 1 protein [Lichenihabitans sp. Uapishka_5]|uniref:glycosyltransferase family 4 protein n=1 Tax=Lichenihabitans sp. Uapishka_5 TaxID=3037302 RepID=UPI0029E7D61C|nr:glycosyltransferase family 1 protein [Lichenihabitans sp. Uapishka_5]MDX7950246.1 glycosyltransferase family 1 protein [Lichenihabitans sp. Uapishka_5]
MTTPVSPPNASPASFCADMRDAAASLGAAGRGVLRERHIGAVPVRLLPPPPGSQDRGHGHEAIRQWTINGDFLGLRPTGIARYGREMTRALDVLLAERHPLTQGLDLGIVAPREAAEPLALRHIPLSIVSEFRPRLPQVWVQWQLPRRVHGGLISFCNLAPVMARKHIVCIHDLQTRTVPNSYGLLFRLAHRLILPPLAKRADVVTTVSAFSKSTFVDFALASPEKIVVVPNGSDHALRWDPCKAKTGWGRDRPFVLCMGRGEAHKNMALVWRIAQGLDALGIDVVLAGAFDARSLDAQAGERPANIRCVGRIDDDALARGFSEALAFLLPSRTEGFGLPAIEAMACGCPVIASRTPGLLELCGDAALFADPDDAPGWIEAIQRLSGRPDLVEALRRDGHLRASRYAWREAALSYLGLMLQVDQAHAAGKR